MEQLIALSNIRPSFHASSQSILQLTCSYQIKPSWYSTLKIFYNGIPRTSQPLYRNKTNNMVSCLNMIYFQHRLTNLGTHPASKAHQRSQQTPADNLHSKDLHRRLPQLKAGQARHEALPPSIQSPPKRTCHKIAKEKTTVEEAGDDVGGFGRCAARIRGAHGESEDWAGC